MRALTTTLSQTGWRTQLEARAGGQIRSGTQQSLHLALAFAQLIAVVGAGGRSPCCLSVCDTTTYRWDQHKEIRAAGRGAVRAEVALASRGRETRSEAAGVYRHGFARANALPAERVSSLPDVSQSKRIPYILGLGRATLSVRATLAVSVPIFHLLFLRFEVFFLHYSH